MVAVGPTRAVAGALVAYGAQRVLLAAPPGGTVRWSRTNHRGRQVSLLSGPALALAAVGTAGLPWPAAAVGGLGSAVVGAYDDAAGARDGMQAKGFRGHLAALRAGRITTGVVKVAGLAVVGLASSALLRREAVLDQLVGGAVVAGCANLVNLLDLRPGRALKAGGLVALALDAPGPAAACAALLPADLGERTMLGDAGANALGAVLGLVLLQRHPERRRTALGVLVAATAASEVVSYSRVIDAVPPLRWLDRAGRRT